MPYRMGRRMSGEVIGWRVSAVGKPTCKRQEKRTQREILSGELERHFLERLARLILCVLSSVLAMESEHNAVDDVRAVRLGWSVKARPDCVDCLPAL